MKPTIHPKYHTQAVVVCACGNTFTTGSVMEKLNTEVCSNCHPFYTGKQKLLDSAGTVDKFKKRTATAQNIKATTKPKKERKTRSKK